eukprot:220644-Amphidinium_carterae.2
MGHYGFTSSGPRAVLSTSLCMGAASPNGKLIAQSRLSEMKSIPNFIAAEQLAALEKDGHKNATQNVQKVSRPNYEAVELLQAEVPVVTICHGDGTTQPS